jgi:hypothetical protein
MRTEDKALAVLCSDIHLSVSPPAARRCEPDWFAAMARTLHQVKELALSCGDVPVICAGDVFDRWNSSPELINFALQELPHLWAIPGQHDLPLHRADLIKKSAFWTLVMAGKISLLSKWGSIPNAGIKVYGFGWGEKITPPDFSDRFVGIRLAAVHSFIWTEDYGYPGVSDDSNLRHFRTQLKGYYDAAVFGDNHKGFLAAKILNAGTLFRRKSDEINYRPSVGILRASGKIEWYVLDISGEVMESVVESEGSSPSADFGDFISGLSNLTSDPLSFLEVMQRSMRQCPGGIRKVLEEVMA